MKVTIPFKLGLRFPRKKIHVLHCEVAQVSQSRLNPVSDFHTTGTTNNVEALSTVTIPFKPGLRFPLNKED